MEEGHYPPAQSESESEYLSQLFDYVVVMGQGLESHNCATFCMSFVCRAREYFQKVLPGPVPT